MEGMLCRCRPDIQRSGLGRDRPGCPAVARPRVDGRDSNANKVDRAKPSKSQARLLSRWTWQANSSRIRTSEIAARLDLFLTRRAPRPAAQSERQAIARLVRDSGTRGL